MDAIQGAAIMGAAGAAGLVFFGRPVWQAWRAGRWPHAEGTVTRSWTETVTREINPTDNTAPTTTRFNVRVNFSYLVGGTTHAGDRVTFFPSTMSHGFPQLAREHCDRYAAGTTLDVRYDPRNPSDAVIETRIPGPAGFAAGLSAVFLIAGLAGLILLLVF
nr:hypothetical protein Hi04_10k_c4711_00012 [uncultured bacterium]